ncbi:SGM_5486 family transporter-associated protein [Streptomyces sp. JJ36]|nr:SGM_5486 family transporter-associated protein [Streptomyces sp. JJ36]
MPVLEPDPPDGRKKLLLVFGTILAILVVIGVVATLASP